MKTFFGVLFLGLLFAFASADTGSSYNGTNPEEELVQAPVDFGTGICSHDPRCPEQLDIHGPTHHISHESNCQEFYACTWNSRACLMYCPAGLHYNDMKQVCDWPENAGCS